MLVAFMGNRPQMIMVDGPQVPKTTAFYFENSPEEDSMPVQEPQLTHRF